MAAPRNIGTDEHPKWTMQIVCPDGKRRTIRIGRATEREARRMGDRITDLRAVRRLGQPVGPELARWLSRLPDTMHDRLVRVGLAEPRAEAVRVTLGALMTDFFAGVDVKPSTMIRMQQAERALLEYFGEERDAATITERDAEGWRAGLVADGYAQATISRTVLYARQIFRWAIRRGLVVGNPFAELKAGAQINIVKRVFIDRETIAKVIDAAPDAEWRLLIALSRFGGLRVPSEALALRWNGVDWSNGRLTIHSPKTERHEGCGERIIPLFPEIRDHLLTVFEQAPEGAEKVIGRYRQGSNLNPQLRRIIQHAGLTPWPRTWHNLRASRQTELAAEYPLHTVCAWIGNTKAIAAGHYLQVTDADWERATNERVESGAKSGALALQNPVQQRPAAKRTGTNKRAQVSIGTGVMRDSAAPCPPPHNPLIGATGLEPVTSAM